MYLLDVCSLRKVPFSVEERVRLQPKLTCSAQKGGGGVPTVQRGEKGWTLKAVLMLSTESISEIHYHIWIIVLPIYSPMFWSFVAR